MGWLRNLLGLNKSPSEETKQARERLHKVVQDDVKVYGLVQERRDVVRANHLGPMIAEALRGKKT